MSLLFAAALAASSAAALPACSWDRPGRHVFTGEVPAAVDRYTDIPAPVRAALKKRMAAYQYDDVAAIRRDSIEGKHSYSDLRDMHFGASQVCRTITRQKWADEAEERGLVYCESGHCVIVPTVCRNVSRVTRAPVAAAPPAVAGAAPGGAAPDSAPLAAGPAEPLLFDPPAAGGETPAGGAVGATSLPSNPVAPSFASGSGMPAPSVIASSEPVLGLLVLPAYAAGPMFGQPLLPSGVLPAVPEPGTALLFVAGAALLLARRARTFG